MSQFRTGTVGIAWFGAVITLLTASMIFGQQRSVTTTETVTTKSTIVAIDKATRTITLRDSKGHDTVVHASDQVQRFDQLKEGDVVSATYTQSVAIAIRKPGAAAPPKEAEKIVRDSTGAKVTSQRTASVTVEEIDIPGMKVVVKDAKGAKTTYKAKDIANLRELKVGDKVDVTFTEGLLLKVDPPK